MVYLIVGKVDSGKTSKLKEIYRKIGRGDGVILEKVFENGKFIGYDAVRLVTGSRQRLAVFKWSKPEGWDEVFEQGRFSFSKSGMDFALKQLRQAIDSGAEPIFIDELGRLELQDMGFAELFRRAIGIGIDVYATCRNSLVEQIVEKFGLSSISRIVQV